MKKVYTLLVCSILTMAVQAQIIIRASDMPVLGDTLRFSTTSNDVSGLVAQTGVGQTWDASSLVPDFQDIAHFKTAVSINILYYTFSGSSFGTEGQAALSIGPLQTTAAYNFYKKDTFNYVQNGQGFSVQGLPLTQTWNDTVLRFPLMFESADSCKFLSNEANALIATLTHVGKRVNFVDGYGSITTPYGAFPCLRVKSILRTVDTLKTSLIPFPIPIPQNITEYKWYAKGKKIPVLEIDVNTSTGAVSAVRYRDFVRPEAFLNQAQFTVNKNTFAANSSTDTCILTDNSAHPALSRSWTITPNTYQFTGGTDATVVSPKLFFTAPGVYTVKLHVNYAAGSDDTTEVNIITVGEAPKADFRANHTNTNSTTIVSFADSSKGVPTSWYWTFIPPTVSYVGGTSATSQNPNVLFNAAGLYSVNLNIMNSVGSDTLTKINYISVVNTGIKELSQINEVMVYPNPASALITVSSPHAQIIKTELFDLAGKRVEHSTGNTLNVSNVNNGSYLIRVYSKDGVMGAKAVQILH